MKRVLIISLPAVFLLTGCPAPRVLPDVPRVEFRSFILELKPNALGNNIMTGTLDFHFEDGDGDIGFNASVDSLDLADTLKYNLFLTKAWLMLCCAIILRFRSISEAWPPGP